MHELESDGIDGDSRERKHDELTRRRESQVGHCQFDLFTWPWMGKQLYNLRLWHK